MHIPAAQRPCKPARRFPGLLWPLIAAALGMALSACSGDGSPSESGPHQTDAGSTPPGDASGEAPDAGGAGDSGAPGDAGLEGGQDSGPGDGPDAGNEALSDKPWLALGTTPGGCGLADYTWLGTNTMGEVVGMREARTWRLGREQIAALLERSGYAREELAPQHGARVFRMRYSTQDKGARVEATGLVAVPWDGDQAPPREHPLVLFLHGTTGFMGDCAPSRGPDSGTAAGLALLASQGYIVAAPDYIGLDADAPVGTPASVRHNYLGIEQTALGSLDMLRATARLFGPTVSPQTPSGVNARATRQTVLWGGSQGGHAAFAADLLAPYYAPQFDVVATVALVPPTDLPGLARYATSAANPASAALAAVLASMHQWYEGSAPLGDVLSNVEPWQLASRITEAMYTGCEAGDALEGMNQVEHVFQPAFIAAARQSRWDGLEPWQCYLRENSLATARFARQKDVPVLFVTSELDDLVYTPVERESFEHLCDEGYRMEYLECAGAGHSQGAAWSLPQQLRWVGARLAGQPWEAARICARGPAQECEL